MSIEEQLRSARWTTYVLMQPWVKPLTDLYGEAYWRVTASGLEGQIHLGYVQEAEYGLPFKDWAYCADNDSWIWEKIVFSRNIGNIGIKLRVHGYVAFSDEEQQLLRQLGRLETITPEPYTALTCR